MYLDAKCYKSSLDVINPERVVTIICERIGLEGLYKPHPYKSRPGKTSPFLCGQGSNMATESKPRPQEKCQSFKPVFVVTKL